MLQNNILKVPDDTPFPDTSRAMPYVFVGDEAFAVSPHVMRPYANRGLSIPKRIFNYRLCRARRNVEYSFEILANKLRILHRALDVNTEFCVDIVKACCTLHNFVRDRDGFNFEELLYSSNFVQ